MSGIVGGCEVFKVATPTRNEVFSLIMILVSWMFRRE